MTFCSGRYGGWHSKEKDATIQKNVPRVLVYIMGGVTFSEFRVGYEITNDRKSWEVIVGKLLFFSYSNHYLYDHISYDLFRYLNELFIIGLGVFTWFANVNF